MTCQRCGSVVGVEKVLVGGILESGEPDDVEGVLCPECADDMVVAWASASMVRPRGGAAGWYWAWLRESRL